MNLNRKSPHPARAAHESALPRFAEEGLRTSLNSGQDRFEHTFQVLIDIVVPEAQDFKSLRLKMRVSDGIALTMRIEPMLTAISLDDYTRFEAGEVQYVSVLRNLPAKMVTKSTPRP
jgi:hypothetical protein